MKNIIRTKNQMVMAVVASFLLIVGTGVLSFFSCASASDVKPEGKEADEFYNQGLAL